MYLFKKSVICSSAKFFGNVFIDSKALKKWNLFCHALLISEREWKIGELYKQLKK